MRSTSESLNRRAISTSSNYASTPAAIPSVPTQSAISQSKTTPQAIDSELANDQELLQLRQQVAEQRDQLNTLRTEKPVSAG